MSNDIRVDSDEIKNITEYLKSLKFLPTADVSIIDKQRIYKESGKTGSAVHVEGLYDLLWFTLPHGKEEELRILYDPDKSLDLGVNNICWKMLTRAKQRKLLKVKKIPENIQLCERIDALDSVLAFEKMNEFNIDWKNIVWLWVTENCIKDDRLIYLMLSIPVPIRHLRPEIGQSINNHMLLITNTGAGKSSFSKTFGKIPVINPTIPGLFGSARTEEPGECQGDGFLFIDELNVNDTELIKFSLTYLENGELVRSTENTPKCTGTKTWVINGNPAHESEDKAEDDIREFIMSIAGSDTPSRVGRRFALLMYGNDFIEVNEQGSIGKDYIDKIRLLYNATLNQHYDKIYNIIQKSRKWIYVDDNLYKEKVLMINKLIENDFIRGFFKGMALGSRRTKMAGLKSAILMNLDKIVLNSNQKDVFIDIIRDAKTMYNYYKHLNINSMMKVARSSNQKWIKSNYKFVEFWKLYKQNPEMKQEEFAKQISLSQQMISLYMQKIDGFKDKGIDINYLVGID